MNLFVYEPLMATTDPGGDATRKDVVETAVEATFDAVKMIATIGAGLLLGLLAGLVFIAILRVLARRSKYDPIYSAVSRRVEMLFAVLGAWLGFHYRLEVMPAAAPEWLAWVEHAFVILFLVVATWALAGLVDGVTHAINNRMAETSEGRAARVKTQTQILRRVIIASVWLLGIAGVLLTFPGARAAGASILASAGIISVVAGLAAQTTLSNVFAGLQLAFTDSIRVGDIVIHNGNYTTVEEITLTYVVLAVWDGRRIIVPSTIMTTQSFENWTRRAPDMTGDVIITADWAVPIDAARLRLEQILSKTDLWDGRTGVLQVADASATDRINLRCVVSAKNSPTLTDLRNHVREEMVRWIQEEAPQAIPRARYYADEKGDLRQRNEQTMARLLEREEDKPPVFEPEPEFGVAHHDTQETEVMSARDVEKLLRISVAEREAELDDRDVPNVEDPSPKSTTVKSAIFSGSPEAEERAKVFAGPGDEAYEERKRKLEETREDMQTEETDPDLKERQ
ncbi:mechanosensitive ion channel family protein [Trueperella pecoris]|uniref:Mechanosensitive ion channel n=1 Tax=Trueperella pecoris TaxID=2733571 RepID=A0A7M1QUU3_9ACTO|nr:mechanosensitive ion channel domain-containing protein [Trueperella pecoris]QOQ39466.1 mechanosensitive ion channel [Trueperella pecoris]QOR45912.1 mechanosensitive ion channel [Trueperella pecoris]QTG75741.1 mechanosensitive ion channel [Trueperella pecoris]